MPVVASAGTNLQPDPVIRVGTDPCKVTDIVLAAAVRASADAVYIEPMALAEDSYVVTFERAQTVLASLSIDAQLGTAIVARLAFIADLDLAASHAARAWSRCARVVAARMSSSPSVPAPPCAPI